MCLGHHWCPHKFPQCSVTSLGLGAGGVGLVTHINYGHYCAPVCQCIEWHGASHVPLCCPSGHLPQLAGRMGGILMNLQTNAGSCYIDFSQRTNNINTQLHSQCLGIITHNIPPATVTTSPARAREVLTTNCCFRTPHRLTVDSLECWMVRFLVISTQILRTSNIFLSSPRVTQWIFISPACMELRRVQRDNLVMI